MGAAARDTAETSQSSHHSVYSPTLPFPASGLPKWGPLNLAAIFRNCSYLDAVESVTEKPHKLTWPEVPPEGPMSSSGDMCEMCCPFIPAFRPAITKQEA